MALDFNKNSKHPLETKAALFGPRLPGGHSRFSQERPHVASPEDILVSPRARPQVPTEGFSNFASPEDIHVPGFCRPRRPTDASRSSGIGSLSTRPIAAAPHLSDPAPKHDNTPQRRFSAPTSEDSVAESRNSERARKSRLPSHDTVTSNLKITPRQKNSIRRTTESTYSLFTSFLSLHSRFPSTPTSPSNKK